MLYDLPLWDLEDILIERRRVKFGGNDDDHLRGGGQFGRRLSR